MSGPLVLEIVGYVGSALIAISMMMRSVLRLRLLNLAGAIVLTIYALLIQAWPIVALDGLITIVNSYQIWRLLQERRQHSEFDVLEIETTSKYLRKFISQYRDDIRAFQPEFPGAHVAERAFLILKDALVAGIVLVRPSEDDRCVGIVELDYILPWHRDLQPARYVYEERQLLHRIGFDEVVTRPGSDRHVQYLERIGYERDGDWFRREVG